MKGRAAHVILCALILIMTPSIRVAPASPPQADENLRSPARPLRISFRTAWDADLQRGRLDAWTFDAFWMRPPDDQDDAETPARQIHWNELEPRFAYDILRRVIDRDEAGDWAGVGRVMLDLDARGYADRAFAVTLRLDPDRSEDVARLIEAWETGSPLRYDEPTPETDATDDDATESLDGDAASPPDPTVGLWPELSPEEHAAAAKAVHERAVELLATAGFEDLRPVETEHFLFFSDLTERETRRWSRELDKMYRTLVRVLDLPAEARLFHGRCVIFIFSNRERFIHFEAISMNYDASNAAGVFHGKGPDAFVSFYRDHRDERFASTLVHETVHAFMYRYRSHARLPTWANEGLADYTAGRLITTSDEPLRHWYHAKNFISRDGAATEIMNQSYIDGSWFTADSYPVSHMLVRFMLLYKPAAFKQWIDDIKNGVDWRESLEARFNVTPDRLSDDFARFMRAEREFARE